jgi:hypothetical protein
MGLLDIFIKDDIPDETGEPVYTEYDQVPADTVVIPDGSNADLHEKYGHLITPEQIAAHEAEVPEP